MPTGGTAVETAVNTCAVETAVKTCLVETAVESEAVETVPGKMETSGHQLLTENVPVGATATGPQCRC